ncbi:MAG: DUF883 family protein [Ferrovum sp.]|nr:DUF883 family protein [Ferrovum sp.]
MNTRKLATEKSTEERSDEITKEQLIANFKLVITDAEALLTATANMGGDKLAEVRAKVEDSLRIANARLAVTRAALLEKARAAANITDTYVHKNPWQAIGVATGIGLVIGFLVSRR